MRTLEARLRKIETVTAQVRPDRPHFWIFGHDRADLNRRVVAEFAAGRAEGRDTPFQVIWRGDEPLPPARWMKGSDLTREEEEDWFATVIETLGGHAHPRGDDGAFWDMLTAIDLLKAEIERRDTGTPCRGTVAEVAMQQW